MISRYIDNKELKRVIEDGKIKPYRIKNMLKNEGILLVSKNAEQIAEQVYPILWGSSDIQKMSQSIDDSGNYIKSSIIEIEIEDATEIINEIDDLFANAPYGKSKYSLMSAVKIDDSHLEIKLKYAVSRPGRIEFISTQYKQTDIVVTKQDAHKAIIDVRQASSSEMKEFNALLENIKKQDSSVHTKHISLDNLTNENKVLFFDQFNRKSIPGWRFETVTKVELKKCEGVEEESKELSDEEENSLANLKGISSAILNGTSIRNNSFVQECLQNDFYITTRGYKFECMEDMRAGVVEINFKYDDLKIDICKTYEFDNDSGDLRLQPSLYNVQEEILQQFQKAAYEQYTSILEKQKQSVLYMGK